MMKLIIGRTLLLSLCCTAAASFLGRGLSVNLLERQTGQQISSSGSCGVIDGVNTTCVGSSWGNCCSYLSYCGSNSSYCDSGCQSAYGDCGDQTISTNGSCGATTGLTCLGSSFGDCCSGTNFCGNTSDYCGQGCQSEFGTCPGSAATSSTTSSRSASTSASTSASSSTTSMTASSSAASSVDLDKSTAFTSTTGFKAMISVLVIVFVLVLGIAVVFYRRRRARKSQVVVQQEQVYAKSANDEYQQRYQEMDGSSRAELPNGRGVQSTNKGDEPNEKTAHELPATSIPHENT